MTAIRKVPTTSIISSSITGENTEIFTYYDEIIGNVISIFISEIQGIRLGSVYQEGETVVTMQNSPEEVDFEYDSDTGDLLVYAKQEDIDKYSLNTDTGEVNYTETI